MRRIFTLLSATLFFFVSQSQEIAIATGTDLHVSPGTIFSAGGLSLTPSTGFTLNGNALARTTTTSHGTANKYVSRVYQFSNTTAAFSGSIQFSYLDGELNGIAEPSLQVNIHNGAVWTAYPSAVNDGVNNYVLASTVAGRQLNELTLASALRALPAQWGAITAYRRGREVIVEWATEQENGVDNFAVERSTDARVWYTVAENIPATNRPYRTQYTQTDGVYHPEQLYYRIRQTCNDSITYSFYAVVPAENSPAQLFVYPNPVSRHFSIAGIDPAIIKLTELYDASGILVKAWTGAQAHYLLPVLKRGTYYIRVHTTSGTVLDKTVITQ